MQKQTIDDSLNKAGILYKFKESLSNLGGYYKNCRGNFKTEPAVEEEKGFDTTLSGYPRNHNYRIRGGKVVPSFRLYCRERVVTALFPDGMESFLDIGCCRGYYVFRAAQSPQCRLALGIDVFEPFVSLSNQVKKFLGANNAEFKLASIEEVGAHAEKFGGPFQTVMTIGTYHYLFWGSSRSENAFYDHRRILSLLAGLCRESLIFSGRLELERLPSEIAAKALAHEKADTYNTAEFLAVASEFFKIRKMGLLGAYPVFLMTKNNN